MFDRRWEKWAPAAGIVFVALLVLTIIIGPHLPNGHASAAKIAGKFNDHRRNVKVSMFLNGLALVFWLWFLASLGQALRQANEMRMAVVAYGAGVVTAAIVFIANGIQFTLAWHIAAEADPATTKLLYQLSLGISFMTAFGVLALAAATALGVLRSAALPAWVGWLSIVGVLVFLLGGLAMKEKGFFAPDGGYSFLGFMVFLVWVLATSVALLQQSRSLQETPGAAMPV